MVLSTRKEGVLQAGSSKKTGRISAVINIVVTVAIVLVALLMLLTIATQNGASVLGMRSYIILTGSMSPHFDAGSYILVQQRDANDIKVGDVITYQVQSSDAILTHRVMQKAGEGSEATFITQGDANNAPDPNPVDAASVRGVQILAVPGFGSLLLSLRNPVNIAFALGIILVLFLVPVAYRALTRSKDSNDTPDSGSGTSGQTPRQTSGQASVQMSGQTFGHAYAQTPGQTPAQTRARKENDKTSDLSCKVACTTTNETRGIANGVSHDILGSIAIPTLVAGLLAIGMAAPVSWSWLMSKPKAEIAVNSALIATEYKDVKTRALTGANTPLVYEYAIDASTGAKLSQPVTISSKPVLIDVSAPGDFVFEISVAAGSLPYASYQGSNAQGQNQNAGSAVVGCAVIESLSLRGANGDELNLSPNSGSGPNIFYKKSEEYQQSQPVARVSYYGYWHGARGTLTLGSAMAKFNIDSVLQSAAEAIAAGSENGGTGEASQGLTSAIIMPFAATIQFRACQATKSAVQEYFGNDVAYAALTRGPDEYGNSPLLQDYTDASGNVVSYAWNTIALAPINLNGMVSFVNVTSAEDAGAQNARASTMSGVGLGDTSGSSNGVLNNDKLVEQSTEFGGAADDTPDASQRALQGETQDAPQDSTQVATQDVEQANAQGAARDIPQEHVQGVTWGGTQASVQGAVQLSNFPITVFAAIAAKGALWR